MATSTKHHPHSRNRRVGILPRKDSIALFSKCIDVFGSECLRCGNFPHYMKIEPTAFDIEDQHVALQTYVFMINAVKDEDERVKKLRQQIEGYFGPIDRAFVATLYGLNYSIGPAPAGH